MCECPKACREPTPTLTGMGTGNSSLTVLLLLRLTPTFAEHYLSSSWMQSAFDRLKRSHEDFDLTKSRKDDHDGLPFSEGSEECFQAFLEDHAR